MSRAAWSSPTLKAAVVAVTLVGAAVALLGFAAPAQAAKPCWERVIDDWIKDARIDGVYPTACLQQAKKHLPEDLRAYSNFEEAVDSSMQSRTTQGVDGTGGSGKSNVTPAEAKKITKHAGDQQAQQPAKGPIDEVLNAGGPSSADSVPLPLIILAGLALALLAAGGAGLAHRKLAARRASR